MNVLFISPNSPYESIGGVERYIVNLLNYCKSNTEHNIVFMLPSNENKRTEDAPNIVTYLDTSMSYTKNLSNKEISATAQMFSKNLRTIIADHKIDIICTENFHVGVPPAYSLLVNMVAEVNNIPLVLRLHSFATTPLHTELINQLMWKKVSCVSRSVAGDCFQKGADVDILSTDYLGVSTEEFRPSNTDKDELKQKLGLDPEKEYILIASRIILGRKNILHEKGFINLIQAFSKLSPRYPKLNLLIAIGRSPDRLKKEFDGAFEMLQGYIKLHDVTEHITVKMFKLDEMPDVYRASHVFALPSENETFGQVFIESMASGLPVIGTKTGGVPEIISDNYNGYLVPPDDSSVLAQRIERLINDKSLHEKFANAGIKTVGERFASDLQFEGFFSMLKSVTGQ